MRLDETALNYSDNMFLILKDHWPSTTQSSYYIELRPNDENRVINFQVDVDGGEGGGGVGSGGVLPSVLVPT